MRRDQYIKTIAFVLVFFVIDWGTYRVLNAGFQRIETGEQGGMVNAVLRSQAEVVVVGNSRAWHHYDTPYLQQALGMTAYNGGCNGQGTEYACAVADLALRRGSMRMLIMHIDPSGMVDNPAGLDRAIVLAPQMSHSEIVREVIYRRSMFEPLKRLLRSAQFNSMALAIFKNLRVKNPTELGYSPLQATMEAGAPREFEFDRKRQQGPLVFGTYQVELVRRTVRAAIAKGVQVIIVTGPYYRPDGRVEDRQRHGFEELRRIAAEEGAHYVLLSLETQPAFSDTSLWVDNSHLNERGARVFTELLIQEMRRLHIAPTLAPASGVAVKG